MARDRLVTLAIALLCMTTIGVSATTLESTVSSTPDDALDLHNELPLGEDSAADIDREIAANKKGQQEREESGDTNVQQSVERSSGEEAPRERSGAGRNERQTDGAGTGLQQIGTQPFLQRLLALLAELLPYLLVLLGVAVFAGLLHRYRERLLALLFAPFGSAGGRDRPGEGGPDPWADLDVSDEVDRAWYRMVSHLDVDRPWTKTPAEIRRRAVDSGLDQDAVRTLTDTFREARYAETGATPEHETRARESLDRLGLGSGSA
jgi:hypothetical protein